MSATIPTRYILSTVHGNPNGPESHVILEIHPNVVELVSAASKVADLFANGPFCVGYPKDAAVLSPRVGGELVFQDAIPEWLQFYLVDFDDPDGFNTRLLPPDFDHVRLHRSWQEDARYRFETQDGRYRCGIEVITCELTSAVDDSYEFHTLDLRPLFDALASDFEHPGFSIDEDGNPQP